MTQEEKAKRYDEAIERARYWEKNPTVWSSDDICQKLFPELTESEDEIIRKALLTKFTNEKKQGGKYEIHGVSIDNIITWLEKQGQVKDSAISQHENKTCKENDESLTSDGERIKKWIIAYLEDRVMNTSITDEKNNCLGAIRWLEKQCEQKPADLRTTGYWHVEDVEQKPAWSEEDGKIVEALNAYVKNLDMFFSEIKIGDKNIPSKEFREKVQLWLKSLKDRVQPKHAEWSEEDEVKINRIVACLENLNVADNDILLKDVAWLKSLRPQNHWKPSDEQMEALLYEVNAWDEDSVNGQNLKSLYQDLKKLMEE